MVAYYIPGIVCFINVLFNLHNNPNEVLLPHVTNEKFEAQRNSLAEGYTVSKNQDLKVQ